MTTLSHPDEAAIPHAWPIADLYVAHHGWLLAWLRRRLGCSEHAADLTQDTFVQVMAGAQPVSMQEPRAYLTVIAKCVLFNFWRRRDLEQAYLAELAALPEQICPSAEERVLVLETLLEIDRLLDGLSHKARCAFLMSQLDGMTYKEIAAELKVSVSRVRQYMAQALARCYTTL